jgi:hypothetical protein
MSKSAKWLIIFVIIFTAFLTLVSFYDIRWMVAFTMFYLENNIIFGFTSGVFLFSSLYLFRSFNQSSWQRHLGYGLFYTLVVYNVTIIFQIQYLRDLLTSAGML